MPAERGGRHIFNSPKDRSIPQPGLRPYVRDPVGLQEAGTTSSMRPFLRFWAAVRWRASAAVALVSSLALSKGWLRTLRAKSPVPVYSSMATRSATAIPNAPPEPPSPMTHETMGVSSRLISRRLKAMASTPTFLGLHAGVVPGCRPSTQWAAGTSRPTALCSALRYPSG